MPRKFFKRIVPDPQKFKEQPMMRWLGDNVDRSDCWHITKHSVAGAFFIGLFCCFLPMPFQTVLAGFLALLFKRNLPISVVLVFISNPITIPPMFYFTYWVGAMLLNQPMANAGMEMDDFWQFTLDNFDQIGIALILGSVTCGLVAGLLGYFGIHLFWIWKVKHDWHLRKRGRFRKKLRVSYSPTATGNAAKPPSHNS